MYPKLARMVVRSEFTVEISEERWWGRGQSKAALGLYVLRGVVKGCATNEGSRQSTNQI